MPFEFQSGAVIDTRPDSKKIKDFNFKEAVSSASPVNWIEKKPCDWRRFPDQNQDGSGSCVAQTIKKIAGVLIWLREKTFITFSATPIYQNRSNKPNPGMLGVEAFDIWATKGIITEQLVRSENMNDAQMDEELIEDYQKNIAKEFRISGHIGIDSGDFETVASVIQYTKKAIMTWFYFTADEWSKEIPTINDPNLLLENSLKHSVTAVDFFLYNGKKYILVEDSAHFGGFTYHLISEEFFKARNWFIRYPICFQFESGSILKPIYNFTTPLVFGQLNRDIKALQDILKYEGLFPMNIESTGYYGAITAKGVYQWQIKNNITTLSELNVLEGRRVGNKTIIALNQIYGQ